MTQTNINPRTGKPKYYRGEGKDLNSSAEIQRKRNVKSNPKNNPLSMYVNGKYVSRKHPLYKPGRYKSFGEAAFTALQKDIQIKEGYVYAIRNKAWPEWVKIGKAIDAQDRLNGYQTSSPMRDYELIHAVYFDDRNQAERDAHTSAERKGERQCEWFKITEEQALGVLREVTLD